MIEKGKLNELKNLINCFVKNTQNDDPIQTLMILMITRFIATSMTDFNCFLENKKSESFTGSEMYKIGIEAMIKAAKEFEKACCPLN